MKKVKNPQSDPVLLIDVETTGSNPAVDQVIELCMLTSLEDVAESSVLRIKPSVDISPEAQAVHHISKEDLADCPSFSFYASQIYSTIENSYVIIGYNLEFDLNFIQAEFQRLAQPCPKLQDKLLVDPYRIWRAMEPRNLSAAYKRFVGDDLSNAHSAVADTFACGKVLQGMIKTFNLSSATWQELSELGGLKIKPWIGPSYHFQWQNGKAIIGFGKHKNRLIADVAKEDNASYLKWLAKGDFPKHVKEIAKAASDNTADNFNIWLAKHFG